MVIELCRHGARSPINMQYNITKQYWPEGEGILTYKGAV